MQFWASEQYQRDIPLVDPASHLIDPAGSPYSRRQIRAWKREVDQLNRAGEGDTAAVFFRLRGPARPAAIAGICEHSGERR